MTGPNASSVTELPPPEMPVEAIPVLSTVLPDEAVSQALRDALNARFQDKLYWMALEASILQNLRPKMERLVTELVRKSCREAWLQRSQVRA